MYTKTTAACGSHCNGKHIIPKTFGPRLTFSLPMDFRLKYPFKSSLQLYPLAHLRQLNQKWRFRREKSETDARQISA